MSVAEMIQQDVSTRLRVGLFGDTRSGKTVYLATLYWLAKHGGLPAGIGLRPADNESVHYLGDRVATLEAGQWPEGTIDSSEIRILLDRENEVLCIKAADFRGGDFGRAFYDGSRLDAERFLQELYSDCSAYVFLVDPGDILQADCSHLPQEHQRSERLTGSIPPALEVLRQRAGKLWLFHPPVAVVFTKTDQYPDVVRDPAGFAEKHMRVTWDYLHRHAPQNHRFFAISSTGPLHEEIRQPPQPLRPQSVLDPLLWCADAHKRRIRTLMRLGCVILATAVALLYIWLHVHNSQQLKTIRAALPRADASEIHTSYQRIKGWQGASWFLLTHPKERGVVLQEVISQAEMRSYDLYKDRCDDKGNLRTVADYVSTEPLARAFSQEYPGTEPATRITAWLAGQRYRLAQMVIVMMEAAAERGDEKEFRRLEGDLAKVAVPDLEPRRKAAEQKLYQVIVRSRARDIWNEYQINPRSVGRIRDLCNVAEEAQTQYGVKDNDCSLFISLMRQVYDGLAIGTERCLKFRIETPWAYSIKWSLKASGKDVPTRDGWISPLKVVERWYRADGDAFPIDLLQPPTLELSLWLYGYTGNSFFSRTFSAYEVCHSLESKFKLMIDQEYDYYVIFSGDEFTGQFFKRTKQIEALGEKLFRSASSRSN